MGPAFTSLAPDPERDCRVCIPDWGPVGAARVRGVSRLRDAAQVPEPAQDVDVRAVSASRGLRGRSAAASRYYHHREGKAKPCCK